MTAIASLDIALWRPLISADQQRSAVHAIEGGGVLVLPRLAFRLDERERRFLSPKWSDGRAKNISFDGRGIKGASGSPADRADLTTMITRYAADASALVTALFPRYVPYLKRARTSYRPQPATGRNVSWRKDDSRLHVDAFPSRPNQGERILRVFTNVSPDEDRVWRVGDSFEAVASTFLPQIRAQWPGEARLLSLLQITKGRRSQYDHLMLGLHDSAKGDLTYQANCPQQIVHFAPGTTWLCFSDQLMHAAMSGQYMFEQTVHLPVSALYDPQRSPLAILERLTHRTLVQPADVTT